MVSKRKKFGRGKAIIASHIYTYKHTLTNRRGINRTKTEPFIVIALQSSNAVGSLPRSTIKNTPVPKGAWWRKKNPRGALLNTKKKIC